MSRLVWDKGKTGVVVLACAVMVDALVSLWQINQNKMILVWAVKATAANYNPNMENQSAFAFGISFFVDLLQVPRFFANSVLLVGKERA